MSRSLTLTLIMAGIFILGFAGVVVRARWARVLVWLLSLPLAGVGVFVLHQGGLAEPFSAAQMWRFCAVTFWPVLGCALGQVLLHRRFPNR